MRKLIYPLLGLAFVLSVSSCLDEWKAKYWQEKTIIDDGGIALIQGGLEGGMTEIKASTLALSNSQNPDVKSFAQMMITDHSKADSALTAMEFDKMLSEKDTISGEHQEMIDSLATKKGADFDKAYLAMMIAGHKEAEALFAEQSDDKNQTIQDFARATLPTIQMHLEKAKEIAGGLK
jgi:putative membrane protein